MAEYQTYICDAVTGLVLDRIQVNAFKYERLLSAGDSTASANIPLDRTYSAEDLRVLLQEWSTMLVLERDGAIEYIGYVTGSRYQRGQSSISVTLSDLWTLLGRRLAVDHTVANVEKWKTTLSGTLAFQAATTILLGRSGVTSPAMGFPLTVQAYTGAASPSRILYGYQLEYISDVLADMLDEGLDIYFKPRWASAGVAGWLMEAGTHWVSGVLHELYVTAEGSAVAGFSESVDASRVTNNAVRIGEGSEVDMLVRSQRNAASTLPLLERQTSSKAISSVAQLSALAGSDLSTFGAPTTQWEFQVSGDSGIDVGDWVRLYFVDDPWIGDGFYTRRVVKVAGGIPGPDFKTISVQPVGGA